MTTRLYTFVAGLYLGELQKGLQSAHVIGELYNNFVGRPGEPAKQKLAVLDQWLRVDKTIIIATAMTSGGVLRLAMDLNRFGELFGLPTALFCEDQESLGGAATACGIVVPERFYDVKYITILGTDTKYFEYIDESGTKIQYGLDTDEFAFIQLIKSFRLA